MCSYSYSAMNLCGTSYTNKLHHFPSTPSLIFVYVVAGVDVLFRTNVYGASVKDGDEQHSSEAINRMYTIAPKIFKMKIKYEVNILQQGLILFSFPNAKRWHSHTMQIHTTLSKPTGSAETGSAEWWGCKIADAGECGRVYLCLALKHIIHSV